MITVEIGTSPPVKYGKLTPGKAVKILDEHIIGGRVVEEFALGMGSERVG
jgi:(2Fe-2S) ferredoxin